MPPGQPGDGDPPAPLPRRVVLVGLSTWLLFALAWWRVVALDAQVNGVVLLAVLGSAVFVLATDTWWVGHNRRIYRDKGPRRGRPAGRYDYSLDSVGRPVRLLVTDDCPAEIELSLSPVGEKVYRAVP